MRFEFKYEDVKLAIEANLDELAALGKEVVELAENDISIQDIMNMVMSGRVPDSFNPEKKEKEESEEPEKATDAEELRDDYISKLRELGYPVIVEDPEKVTEEERFIECHTFCDVTSNKEKAALVRAWLKKKEIKYTIDSFGIKKYVYQLTPIQLIELQRYLKDNDVVSCDAVI
jgi:hypothetical protein